MNITKWIYRLICIFAVAATALAPSLHMLTNNTPLPLILLTLFIFINIKPSFYNSSYLEKRLVYCANGAELLIIFLSSLTVTLIAFPYIYFNYLSGHGSIFWFTILSGIIALAIVFWNGIIRVYLTSVQLGIRYRILGIILGWIFPANLIMLGIIIHTIINEVKFENDKIILNRSRINESICKTKYPIVMVHGVFFRDYEAGFLNYWGRIPDELTQNGATIFYGCQQSADSVANCGAELAEQIKKIIATTNYEKVNIIAHSKGGLDSRYAIAKYGLEDMVASLTTINTPHRGCEFADYLLDKIPENVQNTVATTYNASLKKLGDHNPDFLKAVYDLTHNSCTQMNNEIIDSPKVFYQSIGSHMKKASGGRFPLNYSFHLVKYFDGPNDGLVGEDSFEWGSNYKYLEPSGNRGISHGDMIDLNRENFDGFDVREFYVQLIKDLKDRGF